MNGHDVIAEKTIELAGHLEIIEMETARIQAELARLIAEKNEACELLARTLDLREMGMHGPHKEAIRAFLRRVWKGAV